MIFRFKKTGDVTINNGENEPLMLTDPKGQPKEIHFNFESDKLLLVTHAWDAKNSRTWPYSIQLDAPAQQAMAQFFLEHIVRLAEQHYPEFENLDPDA